MATNENTRRASSAPAWTLVVIMAICAVGFLAFIRPDISFAPAGTEGAKKGAIGNQAPGETRGSFNGVFTVAATPIPGVAQSEEESQRLYQQAIQQGNAPAAQPLPLNSAGQPVISQEQQAQQALSLNLAEQEGAAAADAQLAAQRAAANADAANRAPDVSYQEAVDLLHRDPCHVPRANPATCAQGLFKPTPVN